MDVEEQTLLTIGQMARRLGLPARTIRYWSDVGVVPPTERSGGGYRLYDAEAVARLELVRTLRELGLGLEDVRRVLEKETTVAEVAAAHVEALDLQIRTLRLRRAVLSTVAKGRSSTEEMVMMNKLARLSAEERKQLIDDFVAEVFRDLEPDPGLQAHAREAPVLPDDPTPEQVDAWVELAELVQDPDFRRRVRAMAEYGARVQGRLLDFDTQTSTAEFVRRVVEQAGTAAEQGVAPDSPQATEIVDAILSDIPSGAPRAKLLEKLEASVDPRAESYWQLVGVINNRPRHSPVVVPAFEWLISALRAHS
jgi:DNA-binding transcriptional MerR regulator